MNNYIVNYSDESGKTGFFDAPALNSVGALSDFLAWCVEAEIKPVSVLVVRHD
jgi:hypothetical protein